MSSKKCIVVIGATGSGKSAYAHKLYENLAQKRQKAAILNTDAFQLYKGFSIGTAKPTHEEQEKYNYQLIDILEPSENLDARVYAKLLAEQCEKCWANNEVPILAGGSGLYLRGFLHGFDDLPSRNEALREGLRNVANEKGWPHWHTILQKIDPTRAAQLHPNDGIRIERSLEVYFLTGIPFSAHAQKQEELHKQPLKQNAHIVSIHRPVEELKQRLVLRTELMLQSGWIEEVESLQKEYGDNLINLPAFRAIGYPDIAQYLNQSISYQELIEALRAKTWRYAKRQITWNAKELCHENLDEPNTLKAFTFLGIN